jgi:L,D-transpeptidase catalytic domain
MWVAVLAAAVGVAVALELLRDGDAAPSTARDAPPPPAQVAERQEPLRVRVLPGSGRTVRSRDPSALPPAAALADVPAGMSMAALALRRWRWGVPLYRSPGAARPYRVLSRRAMAGARRAFLVRGASGDRFKVALPTRPNGSTAWIDALQVRVSLVNVRVKVDLTRRRLAVLRGSKRLLRARIGVGRSLTPTPAGTYYVIALLEPRDPGGVYGPFALALSGHSTVLDEFAGGDGRIGIHGTNQPSAIGRRVSHGCIRVRNRVVRRLARLIPLGTPVEISR